MAVYHGKLLDGMATFDGCIMSMYLSMQDIFMVISCFGVMESSVRMNPFTFSLHLMVCFTTNFI